MDWVLTRTAWREGQHCLEAVLAVRPSTACGRPDRSRRSCLPRRSSRSRAPDVGLHVIAASRQVEGPATAPNPAVPHRQWLAVSNDFVAVAPQADPSGLQHAPRVRPRGSINCESPAQHRVALSGNSGCLQLVWVCCWPLARLRLQAEGYRAQDQRHDEHRCERQVDR